MPALDIKNLFKRYHSLQAVSDVSLQIEAGERVALLGHNGAGKTTIIRMILGLTAISQGNISILGAEPGSRKARNVTGFLPESVAFHGSLTGREQLHHCARLKSAPLSQADALLERVGLAHAADRKIRTYSKGMRQRVGLAQVVLGDPKLAILDEPTSGLDPISRHEFYDIVEELAQKGAAILLSSHALTELELRTDRISILSKGKLVANDSLSRLRMSADLPIRVTVTATPETVGDIHGKLGGHRVNGQLIEFYCQPQEKVQLLSSITALGSIVKDVDVTPASLEQLYRHYSGVSEEMH
ncbi:ABC transporter ATP-binding protein [Cohaesibacter sp. CAU 1516]|uniref:ABC transporter ATP-binding protein n=1 Tax=Cohaesibacter sp. CAU 1516 TaxID=2576038 RepID=UPI0010FDF33A|nr:ABC transporter ATP-binding protein [Cohaesibacter sp. CAU 1516]TLP45930.1 ABC transporter ATP-binding protein [Cohaesibacter sp. CAU 1516]